MSKRHNRQKDNEDLLLPWFLTVRSMLAIRANVPKHYQKRMRNYFDDYGCLRCGLSRSRHRGNGLCLRCGEMILARLKRSYERRAHPRKSYYAKNLLAKTNEARALLKDLLHEKGLGSLQKRIRATSSQNPALEVCSAIRISRDKF
jgi:hypothetical protein